MTSADDPRRLLDDAGDGSGELRSGLERMSRDLPDAEQLARMAARLGIPSPPAAQPKPPTTGHPLAAKLAGVAVIAGGIAGIVHLSLRGEQGENRAERSPSSVFAEPRRDVAPAPAGVGSARATPPSVEPRTLGDSAPSAPGTSSVAEEVQPSAQALPPVTARPGDEPRAPERTSGAEARALPSSRKPRVGEGSPSSPASRATSPPAQPPAASAPTETDLLRDARLVLDRSPAQALALSEQHQRQYPNGAFSQEREVIAITALARLGRSAEARGRAERFRSVYPSSPYTARVDRVVPP